MREGSELMTGHVMLRKSYYPDSQMFEDLPDSARRMTDQNFPSYPPLKSKLRCLDIFAGAGGLSLGLHQSGVSTTNWAIEVNPSAAQAYQLNNPGCTVFSEDCNKILSLARSGVSHTEQGQKVPMRGEVDLLCGGPPCQGFSGANRFKEEVTEELQPSLLLPQLCRIFPIKVFPIGKCLAICKL